MVKQLKASFTLNGSLFVKRNILSVTRCVEPRFSSSSFNICCREKNLENAAFLILCISWETIMFWTIHAIIECNPLYTSCESLVKVDPRNHNNTFKPNGSCNSHLSISSKGHLNFRTCSILLGFLQGLHNFHC